MVELVPYFDDFKEKTIHRIADFFGYHSSLILGEMKLTEENYKEAEETLSYWQSEDHELYLIKYDEIIVGFLHLWYKGSIVAWIEDIYVDYEYRSMGIATEAIHKAESIVQQNPQYTAISIDVVPRNESALRLYHKLGFDSISVLTLRKELKGDNKRDKKEKVLGLTFKI